MLSREPIMGEEFQAPLNRPIRKEELSAVALSNTDLWGARTFGGVILAIMVWIGASTQSAQVEIGKINEKIESIKRDRDLALIYTERRLDKLEEDMRYLRMQEEGRKEAR